LKLATYLKRQRSSNANLYLEKQEFNIGDKVIYQPKNKNLFPEPQYAIVKSFYKNDYKYNIELDGKVKKSVSPRSLKNVPENS